MVLRVLKPNWWRIGAAMSNVPIFEGTAQTGNWRINFTLVSHTEQKYQLQYIFLETKGGHEEVKLQNDVVVNKSMTRDDQIALAVETFSAQVKKKLWRNEEYKSVLPGIEAQIRSKWPA